MWISPTQQQEKGEIGDLSYTVHVLGAGADGRTRRREQRREGRCAVECGHRGAIIVLPRKTPKLVILCVIRVDQIQADHWPIASNSVIISVLCCDQIPNR